MKKIKWVMVALVLCLSLIGGAYAGWSESTIVTGGVVTGHIAPIIVDLSGPSFDLHNNYDDTGDLKIFDNVSTDIYITANGKNLIFSIGNDFPGLSVGVAFGVKNDGTAPVILQEVKIRMVDGLEVHHDNGIVNLGTHIIHIHSADAKSANNLVGIVVPAGGTAAFEIISNTFEDASQSSTYNYELEFVWGLAYYYDY